MGTQRLHRKAGRVVGLCLLWRLGLRNQMEKLFLPVGHHLQRFFSWFEVRRNIFLCRVNVPRGVGWHSKSPFEKHFRVTPLERLAAFGGKQQAAGRRGVVSDAVRRLLSSKHGPLRCSAHTHTVHLF